MKSRRYAFVLGSLKKGGAERNMAKVASEFSTCGHEVYMVLFQKQIDYALHANIKVIELGIPRYKLRAFGKLVLYFRMLKTIWKIKPYYAISFARLSSQILAATLYPRVIVRYDTYPFGFRTYKWVSSLIMFNFPNVKYVICPSQELLTDVKKYFLQVNKLKVVYNPIVEGNSTTIQGSDEAVKGKPYFVVVARLTTQKQIDKIIQAYANTHAKHYYDLRILGEGNQKDNLMMLTRSLALQDKIHFDGFVFNPYDTMQRAYALLSASNKEGFPNVVVEALSLGTPVISSDCKSGPKEIIEDGINGFLFSVGDVTALSKYIDKIVDDETLYMGLRSRAQDSVSKFSSDMIMNRWKDLLG